jgi:hypothetical protein
MNDPEKRTCPFCVENIHAKAKLCPRCRQWLTWKSFRHPLVMILVHFVPMTAIWVALIAMFSSTMDRLQNPKPYYSDFPDSLKIIEAHMNWAQTSSGLRIYVAGVLTNTSSVGWRDGEFDCRFYDAKGAMIDADVGRGRLVVLAHGESAFRVSIIPAAPTNDYASFKIFVGNARTASGLF